MALDPLSFAALAGSGPMWVSGEAQRAPKTQNTRICKECRTSKPRQVFLGGSDVCQRCEATKKLARKKSGVKKRVQGSDDVV